MENMTRTPYLLRGMRGGYRMGPAVIEDGMSSDGFMDPLAGEVMGETAENLAERYAVSREEQDAFALQSQRRASAAWDAGRFADEVVPHDGLQVDESIRPQTTLEALGDLRPAFEDPAVKARFPQIDWKVTAGNASPINDGSAAVLITTPEVAKAMGATPKARVKGFAVAGDDPLLMLTAVIPATAKALRHAGLSIDDVDLFEVNEAFSSVVLAWQRETGVPLDKVNVNGGAIAIGHPLGASGARITATLVNAMAQRGARYALQTMCEAGGLANAMVLEAA
jgi:acetyl-CoA acyltransferase